MDAAGSMPQCRFLLRTSRSMRCMLAGLSHFLLRPPRHACAFAAPVPAQTEPYGAAAAKLRAFCDAFPEAPDEVVGVLLRNTPAVVTSPPEEVRSGPAVSGWPETQRWCQPAAPSELSRCARRHRRQALATLATCFSAARQLLRRQSRQRRFV